MLTGWFGTMQGLARQMVGALRWSRASPGWANAQCLRWPQRARAICWRHLKVQAFIAGGMASGNFWAHRSAIIVFAAFGSLHTGVKTTFLSAVTALPVGMASALAAPAAAKDAVSTMKFSISPCSPQPKPPRRSLGLVVLVKVWCAVQGNGPVPAWISPVQDHAPMKCATCCCNRCMMLPICTVGRMLGGGVARLQDNAWVRWHTGNSALPSDFVNELALIQPGMANPAKWAATRSGFTYHA